MSIKYIVASNLEEQTPGYGSELSEHVYNKLFATVKTPPNELLQLGSCFVFKMASINTIFCILLLLLSFSFSFSSSISFSFSFSTFSFSFSFFFFFLFLFFFLYLCVCVCVCVCVGVCVCQTFLSMKQQ